MTEGQCTWVRDSAVPGSFTCTTNSPTDDVDLCGGYRTHVPATDWRPTPVVVDSVGSRGNVTGPHPLPGSPSNITAWTIGEVARGVQFSCGAGTMFVGLQATQPKGQRGKTLADVDYAVLCDETRRAKVHQKSMTASYTDDFMLSPGGDGFTAAPSLIEVIITTSNIEYRMDNRVMFTVKATHTGPLRLVVGTLAPTPAGPHPDTNPYVQGVAVQGYSTPTDSDYDFMRYGGCEDSNGDVPPSFTKVLTTGGTDGADGADDAVTRCRMHCSESADCAAFGHNKSAAVGSLTSSTSCTLYGKGLEGAPPTYDDGWTFAEGGGKRDIAAAATTLAADTASPTVFEKGACYRRRVPRGHTILSGDDPDPLMHRALPTQVVPPGEVLACTGECDADADCAEGLVCFQREQGEPVPGCATISGADAGARAPASFDYCVDVTLLKRENRVGCQGMCGVGGGKLVDESNVNTQRNGATFGWASGTHANNNDGCCPGFAKSAQGCTADGRGPLAPLQNLMDWCPAAPGGSPCMPRNDGEAKAAGVTLFESWTPGSATVEACYTPPAVVYVCASLSENGPAYSKAAFGQSGAVFDLTPSGGNDGEQVGGQERNPVPQGVCEALCSAKATELGQTGVCSQSATRETCRFSLNGTLIRVPNALQAGSKYSAWNTSRTLTYAHVGGFYAALCTQAMWASTCQATLGEKGFTAEKGSIFYVGDAQTLGPGTEACKKACEAKSAALASAGVCHMSEASNCFFNKGGARVPTAEEGNNHTTRAAACTVGYDRLYWEEPVHAADWMLKDTALTIKQDSAEDTEYRTLLSLAAGTTAESKNGDAERLEKKAPLYKAVETRKTKQGFRKDYYLGAKAEGTLRCATMSEGACKAVAHHYGAWGGRAAEPWPMYGGVPPPQWWQGCFVVRNGGSHDGKVYYQPTPEPWFPHTHDNACCNYPTHVGNQYGPSRSSTHNGTGMGCFAGFCGAGHTNMHTDTLTSPTGPTGPAGARGRGQAHETDPPASHRKWPAPRPLPPCPLPPAPCPLPPCPLHPALCTLPPAPWQVCVRRGGRRNHGDGQQQGRPRPNMLSSVRICAVLRPRRN